MRARNIKPGFFKNPDLADAGPAVQLLFAGLWCMADKEGRLKDSPRIIKAEIFPYYDMDVNGGLTVLERIGLLRRYVTDGVPVIEVTNFKKHQSPHHTEKSSELPAFRCLTVNSPKSNGGNPSDSLIPDSLIPDSQNPDSKNGAPEEWTFVGKIPAPEKLLPPDLLAITRIFEHWKTVHRHPNAKLDPKRMTLLRQRLAEYSEADLCQSISGY